MRALLTIASRSHARHRGFQSSRTGATCVGVPAAARPSSPEGIAPVPRGAPLASGRPQRGVEAVLGRRDDPRGKGRATQAKSQELRHGGRGRSRWGRRSTALNMAREPLGESRSFGRKPQTDTNPRRVSRPWRGSRPAPVPRKRRSVVLARPRRVDKPHEGQHARGELDPGERERQLEALTGSQPTLELHP